MNGVQHKVVGVGAGIGLALALQNKTDLANAIVAGIMVPVAVPIPDWDHPATQGGKKLRTVSKASKTIFIVALAAAIIFTAYSLITGTTSMLGEYGQVGLTIMLPMVIFIALFSKTKMYQKGSTHRGLFHWLIFTVPVWAAAYFSAGSVLQYICIGIGCGLLAHYLGDLPTERGLALLAPFTYHDFHLFGLHLSSSVERNGKKIPNPALTACSYILAGLLIIIGAICGGLINVI